MDWLKGRRDNSFQQPENDCDVIINVDKVTLYLHSCVLKNFSSVFRDMLNESFEDGERKIITIVTWKAQYIIEFLKYFYPEMMQVVNESSNFHKLLSLCKQYQTTWLADRIEAYLLKWSKEKVVSSGLRIILLADEFNLHLLREKILNNCLSTDVIYVQNKNFRQLCEKTRYIIAKYQLLNMFSKQEKLLEIISEILDAAFNKQPIEKRKTKTNKYDKKNITLNAIEKSDVGLTVGKYHIDSHKCLLSRLSPKLKIMFEKQVFKEYNIDVDGISPQTFIEMLMFFYPTHRANFTEYTNFESLIVCIDVFEVSWLKRSMENFIADTVQIDNMESSMWGLCLSDHLNINLKIVRENILCNLMWSLTAIHSGKYFKYLKHETRYIIMIKRLPVAEYDNYLFRIVLRELNNIILNQNTLIQEDNNHENTQERFMEDNAQAEERH